MRDEPERDLWAQLAELQEHIEALGSALSAGEDAEDATDVESASEETHASADPFDMAVTRPDRPEPVVPQVPARDHAGAEMLAPKVESIPSEPVPLVEDAPAEEVAELRIKPEDAHPDVTVPTGIAPPEPSSTGGRDSSPAQARLEERRRYALRDIAELDEQIAAGEIDPAQAEELRKVYAAEAAEAARAARAAEAPKAAQAPKAPRAVQGKPSEPLLGRRRIMGGVVIAVALAVVLFAVIQAVEPRPPGGLVTGGTTPTDVDSGEGVDLDQIPNETLEQIVAENPDIVDMRLALARRYVDGGDFQAALPHYMTVLAEGPNAEALAYLGWMTYQSGEPEQGARLVERALEVDDGNPLALAFLAVIRFDGLGDAVGAQELLDRLATNPHLPDDLRQSVEEMEARISADR